MTQRRVQQARARIPRWMRRSSQTVIIGALALCACTGIANDAAVTHPHAASAPAAAAAPAAPAAQAAPPHTPEWRTVFFDDFNRAKLGSDWSAYSGRPSSDPRVWWDPTMVWLKNGSLVLAGAPSTGHSNLWRTGAVSQWKSARTYGKWEICFRTHTSQVLSYHFLLWPQANTWPPEIDIAEGYSRDRSHSQAFVHWVNNSGSRQQTSFTVNGKFTQWNTVSVEWTPDSVRFLLNGAEYGKVTGSAVPHEPMFLALQTESRLAKTLQGQSSQTQMVWIDWVRISAPAAGQ